MINITIEDRNGTRQDIVIPEGINLSLMEVLKASEYNILATCGGMGICATCHVQVLEAPGSLPPVNDTELDMLDTLPEAGPDSRLSCQIRVNENIAGAVFRIKGESNE
ncbi:2Fe-2S iron-sulfur cluster-binding protein [Adhaeribacter radiodurans]|uniref:(2Fe-2S)-binding protein n=1 Tax=Adhaeribacter radiodurans TaxID=2745197 RepID=A0A7L7L5E1_9BACT|nr:2Fe-2S iron-sulfur cluster-binding protein [Adhaeribacter radiodurans]QMU28022.1 (2Fe-2S)-binding protein [Adhaeribacter radiodurans]